MRSDDVFRWLMTHWRDYFDLRTFEKAMEEATALN